MQESSSRHAAGMVLACVLLLPLPAWGVCPPLNDCFRGPSCNYIGDGTNCTVDACGAGGNGVCGSVIGGGKQCIRQPGATSCNEVQCQTSSCPLPAGCDRPSNCIRQGTCQFTPTPGASCSDGNQCTANDVCSGGGTCTPGTPIAGCQPCSSPTQCDDGNPCTTDTCPAGTCQHGSAVGVVCRAAAGVCDVAETCTAASAQCPPDAFLPSSTVCRQSAGVCDVTENCTGSRAACPTDAFVPNTTVCRPSAGTCDVAETCTGTNATCPPDDFKPANTVCRASTGVCDVAESCTGSSAACPADAFQSSTTVCRPDAGPCDVAETCTGSSASCPGDSFQPNSVVCRPATGECDTDDMCSGASAQCGPDIVRPDGTACTDDGIACTTDQCNGLAKSCEHVPQDRCVPCTSADQCDDGSACTVDTCEEGFCRFRPGNAGATCRDVAGPCDVAETCTGTSATCPADVLWPPTTVCRPSAGSCDVAETCTGSDLTCPVDRFEAASTVCRSAAGDCDVSETCTGDSPVCPADTQKSEGDSCDDDDPATATSTCQDQQCRGVALGITIPSVIEVPATQPPNKVKIPVEIAVPDTAGTQAARVTVQAFVSCLDLPVAGRPAQCGSPATETLGVATRVESTFLPVTRPRTRNLGRTQSRTVRVALPLTKLGQKLFARLKGGEQQRQLPLQITAALRDRQGRTITAAFQSLLDRRR
jgi:hypothetical protein